MSFEEHIAATVRAAVAEAPKKRRGWGEGELVPLPNGRFKVRWRARGRRWSRNFPARDEAERFLARRPVRLDRRRASNACQDLKRRRGAELACEVCGWKPRPPLNVRAIHAHHIKPQRQGGDDTDGNLIPLCPNHHALAHAIFGHRDPGGRAALLAAIREAEEPTG